MSYEADNSEEHLERSLTDVLAELRKKREDIEAGRDITHLHAPPPPVEDSFPPAPSPFAYHLRMVLVDLERFLLDKNRKDGNSALEPIRVFSRADPITQIDVRIDDNLSRLAHRQDDDTEDTERDTLGHLVLKEVARRMR